MDIAFDINTIIYILIAICLYKILNALRTGRINIGYRGMEWSEWNLKRNPIQFWISVGGYLILLLFGVLMLYLFWFASLYH